MLEISKLVRENIRDLEPYSSAREEYKGAQATFLDANENPYNIPFNRYPDPLQLRLKEEISKIKYTEPDQIFLGNGSDEAIDLIIRAFCEPGIENIVTIEPTYGMYPVAAAVNDVYVRKVPLQSDFQLPTKELLKAVDQYTKAIILCSPNNPTGNCFRKEDILYIADHFNGILVVDEAYIDFSPNKSVLKHIDAYPNLIVLHTFSKAWGLAGIRLGMAFAQSTIIDILNKIKYPYNVNILTIRKALKVVKRAARKEKWVNVIIRNRDELMKQLKSLPVVETVYPSDANFFLIRVADPELVYNFLVDQKIIVRDRSKLALCKGCLRITVGKRKENKKLVDALKQYDKKNNNE